MPDSGPLTDLFAGPQTPATQENGIVTPTLADLQLPEPLGWWPPAPGWWLLAVLVLVLAVSLWHYLRRRQQHADAGNLRAAALAELQRYHQQYQHAAAPDASDHQRFIHQVSALLKRVALLDHDPAQLAPLNGAQWANFLTRNQPEACRREIRELLEQSYRTSPATLDAEPLYRFARQWLESPESPKS